MNQQLSSKRNFDSMRKSLNTLGSSLGAIVLALVICGVLLLVTGKETWVPISAAISAANKYCPSTPILNRFILKPIATAIALKISGVARFNISSNFSPVSPVSRILP